jgi:hypothetical protein
MTFMKMPEFYVEVPRSELPMIEFKGPFLSDFLSGEAAFVALKKAVDELTSLAPKDHDVIITAFEITVWEVRYIEPHTFLFSGISNDGHHAHVVVHFSQLVARVTYRPKRDESRFVTGFARVAMPNESRRATAAAPGS